MRERKKRKREEERRKAFGWIGGDNRERKRKGFRD